MMIAKTSKILLAIVISIIILTVNLYVQLCFHLPSPLFPEFKFIKVCGGTSTNSSIGDTKM